MLEARNDFIGNIRSSYNQFTRAEKKVADYIIDHPQEILFMSITELAETCGVGDTSVFRFCRTMGLGGYQEFKMKLSLGMNSTDGEDEAFSGEIDRWDDLPTLMQKVLQANQRVLSETATLLDLNALSKTVGLMSAARRIAFFGVGASLTSAQKAADKFLRIEPKVICVNDAHKQAMLAATMGAQDLAIVISYSGSTKDTNAVAKLAKENHATVVAVTRFQKSPLTEFTDYILLCGANENPLQGGSAGVEISLAFIIDLLYTEYYHRNWEKCREYNRRTSASVLNKLY